MLDRTLMGSAPQLEDRVPHGGVAASRHGLARHRYLAEKVPRLAAEAAARRRAGSEQRAAQTRLQLARLRKAAARLIRAATRRPVLAR